MILFNAPPDADTGEEAVVTTVRSHSRHEQHVRKEFRSKLNSSESSEDVRKVFVNTFRELMRLVFDGALDIRNDDAALDGTADSGFSINSRLGNNTRFREEGESSDLSSIVGRLADSAGKRLVRHEKNLDKTESKMYHDRDGGGNSSFR